MRVSSLRSFPPSKLYPNFIDYRSRLDPGQFPPFFQERIFLLVSFLHEDFSFLRRTGDSTSNGSTERRRSVGYGARRRRGGGYFRFSIEAVSNGTKLTQANFPFIEAAWSNWTLLGKVRPPFGEIIRRDIQTNEAPKTGFPATRCFCRSLRQPAGRLRDKSTRKSVVIGAGVPWHPTWWVTQVQQRLCSPSPLFSLPLSFSLSLSVYRVLFSIDDAGKYIR